MKTLAAALVALAALATAGHAEASPASRLVIDANRPLQVRIDGNTVRRMPGTNAAVVDNLYGAAHRVTITNPRGNRTFLNTRVIVPPGHEMRCAYQQTTRHLSCNSVALRAPYPVPPPPPAAQPTGAYAAGYGYPTGGATVSTGGVSVNATAGQGVTLQTGGVTVTGNTPMAGAPMPPAAMPSQVKLVIRNLDGEWADVLVDGRVVAEMYNDAEAVVWITPGLHTVEVREFMDDRPYTSARLNTGYSEVVTLGIREGAPMTCYDHVAFASR